MIKWVIFSTNGAARGGGKSEHIFEELQDESDLSAGEENDRAKVAKFW